MLTWPDWFLKYDHTYFLKILFLVIFWHLISFMDFLSTQKPNIANVKRTIFILWVKLKPRNWNVGHQTGTTPGGTFGDAIDEENKTIVF